MIPSFADVQAAAARLQGSIIRTPVLRPAELEAELGFELYLKCENLQAIGAFKARGATNAVLSLSDADAKRGVVTHSSGNHGAALAYAARARGIACTVVVPTTAPQLKIDAVRAQGATVEICAPPDRASTCARIAAQTGATIVHPFEDPRVIAGQGTAVLELCEDVPELDLVLVPVGGGGLCAGTALTLDGIGHGTRLWGAEPLAVDDAARTFATGIHQPRVEDPVTDCDGLLTALGKPNLEILTGLREPLGFEVHTADEPSIRHAARDLMRVTRTVVEPSGAVVLAVLRNAREQLQGRRVGAVLSGGNTDFRWQCGDLLAERGHCAASPSLR